MNFSRATVLVCLAIVSLGLLTGCARNWTKVHSGLTREAIVERLGKPNLVSQSKDGELVWMYLDRDLNDVPRLGEETEGEKTLLLDLSEKNPGSGFRRIGPYRMILTLIFDEDGTVKRYEYGYVERVGPFWPW